VYGSLSTYLRTVQGVGGVGQSLLGAGAPSREPAGNDGERCVCSDLVQEPQAHVRCLGSLSLLHGHTPVRGGAACCSLSAAPYMCHPRLRAAAHGQPRMRRPWRCAAHATPYPRSSLAAAALQAHVVVLNSALAALGAAQRVPALEALLAAVLGSGKHNSHTWAAVFGAYADAGRPDLAVQLFQKAGRQVGCLLCEPAAGCGACRRARWVGCLQACKVGGVLAGMQSG